jgi:hypothetical protein
MTPLNVPRPSGTRKPPPAGIPIHAPEAVVPPSPAQVAARNRQKIIAAQDRQAQQPAQHSAQPGVPPPAPVPAPARPAGPLVITNPIILEALRAPPPPPQQPNPILLEALRAPRRP